MSMHVEWDSAKSCGVRLLSPQEATNELCAEEVSTEPVLVIGGDGGGCLAVEGSLRELCDFAERLRAAVEVAEYLVTITSEEEGVEFTFLTAPARSEQEALDKVRPFLEPGQRMIHVYRSTGIDAPES